MNGQSGSGTLLPFKASASASTKIYLFHIPVFNQIKFFSKSLVLNFAVQPAIGCLK